MNLNEIAYYKESIIDGYISIEESLEPIKKTLSLTSNLQIDNSKLMNTTPLVSNEGYSITKFMLTIQYSFKAYLKYISDSSSNNIFLLAFSNDLNICHFPLPELINNCPTDYLIDNELFKIAYDILNIEIEPIDNRTFYYNIATLFKLIPLN
ncbi:hypothetical protein ACQPU1_13415 [Clostridium paraputrificum]|uniref:hypothetical protein n=1 Tax=Clostridium TaxID=1485 RepID=UPI003D345622